ncbi:MAG TPA: lysylphosphatidylglycerol synthase transmembrane domain-containing protein [Gemmatimonadales bacterium]|nr:lysylphosphatidylglycerol synthase transmembrane domain-containing protein [Gemmatimonadales bacterium]
MGHLLSLALLGVDCIVRAWRIQLAVWTAGGRLSFNDAFRLNLYGEAASQVTPNRLGGEPARFLGLNEARIRPVTGIVAIGVEVACEWPVFLFAAGALFAYYVPDWREAARAWLHRHRAAELVTIEVTALLVLLTVYLLQRLARAGFVRHRVRRQWRVAWAHVRRAPRWALGAGALLTVISVAARALILPALAWGMPNPPPFDEMFFGALALLHAPLIVPLPSGGGGVEVAFLNGFAGDFGARQVTMLLLWRFYTAFLLTILGAYALVRSVGYHAAVQLFKVGWGKRRERSHDDTAD